MATTTGTETGLPAGTTGFGPDYSVAPKADATAPVSPTNNVIVTGTGPSTTFAKNSAYVNNQIQTKAAAPVPATPSVVTPTPTGAVNPTAPVSDPNDPNNPNYSDAYTKTLDNISASSDAATKNLIATIQANRQNQVNTLTQNADRLKSGLMSLGVETGQINFTPDLVYGHIQQAENDAQSKITDINQKEATALLDAQTAAQNKDFTSLKDKVAYIKSLQQERLSALTSTYTQANDEAKLGTIEANQIYDEFQKLPTDQAKTALVAGVAAKFGISPISITTALNKIHATNAKASGKGSTGGTFKTSAGIAQVTPLMESAKGSDGYIDPAKWVAARTTWEKEGGTATSFKSNFIQYLNPESYTIAGYTAPKSSSGSSSGRKS